MERDQLKNILENVLFVADSPLGVDRMVSLFDGNVERVDVEEALAKLKSDYEQRSLAVSQVAEGWRIQTRPEFAPWITVFYKMIRGQKLSRASLEVLAITAYRQPITRAEIDEIRGVDSGGVLRGLIDKNLVKTMGRRKSPGRPMMYGTTRRFLEYFGLGALTDLPTMEEFQTELDAQESLDLGVEEMEGLAESESYDAPEGEAELDETVTHEEEVELDDGVMEDDEMTNNLQPAKDGIDEEYDDDDEGEDNNGQRPDDDEQ